MDNRKRHSRLDWPTVHRVRLDWLSGKYSRRQLDTKYGVNTLHILRNTRWADSDYHPPLKRKGRHSHILAPGKLAPLPNNPDIAC
jgi:hypothetical protein